MPISVCFMIDALRRAGTEGQLLALIRTLPRDRVQPCLVLLDGTDAASQALEPADCPVIRLGVTKLRSREAVRAAGRLKRFWRDHAVDVLQVYFLDSAYFGVPLARLAGIRRIVRVRNNLGHWLTPGHRLLGKAVGRLCHQTLVNCEAAKQSLLAAEGGSPRRVTVLANGVDLGPPPAPLEVGSTLRVGAVANLRPVKALDRLVEATAILRQRGVPCDVTIAGEGSEREPLQRLIDDLGLSDCVRLSGACRDVPAFWRDRDAAVLCSRAEGMSNALLEAMAAGRAVVATAVGGTPEVLRHDRDGLLVPHDDATALADALHRLATDHAHAATLAASARQRVAQRFSRVAMAERFARFYKTTTASRPSAIA